MTVVDLRQPSGSTLGPPRAAFVIALVGIMLWATSCGASEDPGVDPITDGPSQTVAPMRFDGRLTVVDLVLDGQSVPLENRPSLIIDAEFGGLEVRPGCNTRYGSFTLTADGEASFTVAGGTSSSCPELSGQEAAIDVALGRVDAWQATADGVLFTGFEVAIRTTGPTTFDGDDSAGER